MNDAFDSLNKWLKANKFILTFDKTYVMKICTNTKTCDNLNIGYDNKTTEEMETTKFLGLINDSNLNWEKKKCNILSLK
jgi:hypothetical protein